MFYYLGRKKSLAGLYPDPEEDTIVEPFAGSGAYSLHGNRWTKQVILNDLSEKVVRVWRYLQAASYRDIINLPVLSPGDRLSEIENLSEEERWLIGFHVNPGADQNTDVVTPFNRWPAGQRYIAANLFKVKHWQIRHGSYLSLPDLNATWFVDPPYHRSGRFYQTNSVDFQELASWCLAREGHLIVCEQDGATWLPFEPLCEIPICGKATTKEVVFKRGFEDPPTVLEMLGWG